MNAAELIRRRAHLGLSRPALAKQLDVAASTIWRWEKEDRQPHPIIVSHIEAILQRLEREQMDATS